MADIFVSYSQKDRERVEPLVRALESLGLAVWWDPKIRPGDVWDRVIQTALDASRAVIVVWTRDSVGSHWVLAEADEAMRRRVLIPVLLDDIKIPLAFRFIQTLDLSKWSGDPKAFEIRFLAEALSAFVGIQVGERKPLNEGKLILVGFGGVGKTTLVNRLILRRPFNRHEPKTDGICISDWLIPVAELEEQNRRPCTGRRAVHKSSQGEECVRMHVWDFGGQEIMHATHQFFLTARALYVLLLAGREGREDSDAEYWLDMISTFGKDSPVVVVLNKIKQHPFDVNRRALQNKYPNLRGFVETDCEDDTGLDKLENTVLGEISRMNHIRDTFPANWFAVKDRIENSAENFLSFDEYRKLCESVGETDLDSQDTLAAFLHTLGVALNFRDDPRLRDLHVLKPKWVTEGIYSILNDKALAVGRGELKLEYLAQLLDARIYPPNRHWFLLELMRKFELCIRFPDSEDRFLLPELLDKQEPASIDCDSADALVFEYHYEALVPEGLLPRFIVRTSAMSVNHPRWRTGVVLEFEGNRAIVKADPHSRVVRVFITGPIAGRRRLLAVLRIDLESIHRSYGIQPKQIVPVVGKAGLLIPYDKLRVLEHNGEQSFKEVYGEEVVTISVKEMLDGVDLDGVRSGRSDPTPSQRLIETFISFSHKDEFLRAELETHLKLLRRLSILGTWADRCITPGDDWKGEIDDAIERADLVLLLVSSDFVSSDYCWDIEMKRAIGRANEGGTVLVPIIVRTCTWQKAPFARFQALPRNGRAVSSGRARSARDRAWTHVAEEITALAKKLQSRPT